MAQLKWQKIPFPSQELNLGVILTAGQSFRWQKKDGDIYQGVFSGYVWSLKQTNDTFLYYVHNDPKALSESKKGIRSSASSINYANLLKDYFQLDVKLTDLYMKWEEVDSNFAKVATTFPGVRILRQDPVENLFSFICSANNNIPRITSMVEKLCQNYGKNIGKYDGKEFYSFPNLKALAGDKVEAELRALGFGYRAKYINQCAKHIWNNYPPDWLESLRKLSYIEAQLSLKILPGVGTKVADCVCLMSLDKPEAVPVDTHVWQITIRDYLPQMKKTKSLTDKIYRQIGNFYRERFGEYAGWANTVLFASDLKRFKDQTSPK